jgi:hypothetical protein
MAIGPDVQVWATAISTNASTGRKVIFRYARVLSPALDRASQQIRVIIAWRYDSENGQPEREEHQRMIAFEDRLGPVLEQGSFATLTLVSTGEGLREWIYYAQSEDGFAARFNYAFSEASTFPIEIHAAFDPEWTSYHEFKSNVRNG